MIRCRRTERAAGGALLRRERLLCAHAVAGTVGLVRFLGVVRGLEAVELLRRYDRGDSTARNGDLDVVVDLEHHALLVELHDLAVDPAARDDLVARLQAAEHLGVLALLGALRSDQQEPHEAEHR